jgi:transcriptional regulator with XRE-family HTH domain
VTTSPEYARKLRTLNRHRGIPNRVPATEAARHIATLRQTMSWTDISTASGSAAAHLRRIASGKEPRINRVTHNKIMAVRPSPGGHIFVSALGSRRRIQALQARGHSQYDIAAATGTSQYRISLISNGQPTVRLRMAQRIAAGYQQLADKEGTSSRGRNLAAENGWPGPEYWDEDDFDNPDFVPATSDELGRRELGELRRHEIRHLTSCALPEDEIADRLGMARTYVHDLIRDMSKAA